MKLGEKRIHESNTVSSIHYNLLIVFLPENYENYPSPPRTVSQDHATINLAH